MAGVSFAIFAYPFRKPKTLWAFTRSSKGGRVSFISLRCSFAIGLGLTEALHVVPYQRDLELSPARIG